MMHTNINRKNVSLSVESTDGGRKSRTNAAQRRAKLERLEAKLEMRQYRMYMGHITD